MLETAVDGSLSVIADERSTPETIETIMVPTAMSPIMSAPKINPPKIIRQRIAQNFPSVIIQEYLIASMTPNDLSTILVCMNVIRVQIYIVPATIAIKIGPIAGISKFLGKKRRRTIAVTIQMRTGMMIMRIVSMI